MEKKKEEESDALKGSVYILKLKTQHGLMLTSIQSKYLNACSLFKTIKCNFYKLELNINLINENDNFISNVDYLELQI